jgi:hypothetical protein
MSSFTLKGIVKHVGEVQQISESFKKREFVVTENSGQYPQHIMFQTLQDRTSLLDGVNINDTVEVNFNLRGREWTSPQGEVKYFNSMDCWSLNKVGMSDAPQSVGAVETKIEEGEDDLPF